MKPLYRSKTAWFQGLTFAVGVLQLSTEIVPATWTPYILFGISVLNLALRMVTSEGVTLRGGGLEAE